MSDWHPIETAPKNPDPDGLSQRILLGFAPDETGYTLPTVEGYWRQSNIPGWVSCMDPDIPKPQLPPTHWMPLPEPPQ